MTIDYTIWREFKGGPWYWEIVSVPDEGDDETLKSGIAEDRIKAVLAVKDALLQYVVVGNRIPVVT